MKVSSPSCTHGGPLLKSKYIPRENYEFRATTAQDVSILKKASKKK